MIIRDELVDTTIKILILFLNSDIIFLQTAKFGNYLCYKLVKTRSQYYFSIQSYGILMKAKNNTFLTFLDKM